ncbi:predicted protein [Histoplasma capsulatum G186AR]|uniref:Uncharacterized protein n=1 Tax=Ajellomyces capsulatus (strain G186AR / H82 / ATCC MYA-2454 / RMSCC 2432) TaxID=447093 RepID=C0NL55_AJECG|nr:uncharacterized protein HCBG_03885 [Histoplasma capsulatum G186AR]EEH08596.1 predicted protein [Histoplasma capsulatum G186AR]
MRVPVNFPMIQRVSRRFPVSDITKAIQDLVFMPSRGAPQRRSYATVQCGQFLDIGPAIHRRMGRVFPLEHSRTACGVDVACTPCRNLPATRGRDEYRCRFFQLSGIGTELSNPNASLPSTPPPSVASRGWGIHAGVSHSAPRLFKEKQKGQGKEQTVAKPMDSFLATSRWRNHERENSEVKK